MYQIDKWVWCFRFDKLLVQFPNCSRYSKSSYSNPKYIIVTVQPHCNRHFCWPGSLFHLRPKFSVTILTINYNGNSSGTVLLWQKIVCIGQTDAVNSE